MIQDNRINHPKDIPYPATVGCFRINPVGEIEYWSNIRGCWDFHACNYMFHNPASLILPEFLLSYESTWCEPTYLEGD